MIEDKQPYFIEITDDTFSLENRGGNHITAIRMKYKGQLDANFLFGYVPIITDTHIFVACGNVDGDGIMFTYTGSATFTDFKIYDITGRKNFPKKIKTLENTWNKTSEKLEDSNEKWEDLDSEVKGYKTDRLSSVTFKDLQGDSEITIRSDFTRAIKKVLSKKQLINSIGYILKKDYPVDIEERLKDYLTQNNFFKNKRGSK